MELKRDFAASTIGEAASFNWTYMELKPGRCCDAFVFAVSFNWTYMELKPLGDGPGANSVGRF